MAADRDRAEEPMPGLRVADLLEVERGERNVEQRLVVEVLLRPGAEALVGAQSAQGRVVDAEGVEVDGNADDGEGLVDGRELAAVRGEEAAGIVGAVAVAAVEGDALARQLAQGAIGLDVVEAKDAEGVRAVGDVVARGGCALPRGPRMFAGLRPVPFWLLWLAVGNGATAGRRKAQRRGGWPRET